MTIISLILFFRKQNILYPHDSLEPEISPLPIFYIDLIKSLEEADSSEAVFSLWVDSFQPHWYEFDHNPDVCNHAVVRYVATPSQSGTSAET